MNFQYVIWDWNGTLLDDVGASLASVNDMLARRGMPSLDLVRYRECIDVPIINFYKQVFELDRENYPSLLAEYNSGYLFHLKDCGLSAGAENLLSRFAAHGAKQVIVSSSQSGQLTENVRKYGVADYFDAVLGSEDYFARSKIDRAVNYLASNPPGDAVVIGDLVHDLEMARIIGADCFLLDTGHENPQRLSTCGVRIVSNMAQIERAVFDN